MESLRVRPWRVDFQAAARVGWRTVLASSPAEAGDRLVRTFELLELPACEVLAVKPGRYDES